MIGMIYNAMTLLKVSTFYQMVASGLILLYALALGRINSNL